MTDSGAQAPRGVRAERAGLAGAGVLSAPGPCRGPGTPLGPCTLTFPRAPLAPQAPPRSTRAPVGRPLTLPSEDSSPRPRGLRTSPPSTGRCPPAASSRSCTGRWPPSTVRTGEASLRGPVPRLLAGTPRRRPSLKSFVPVEQAALHLLSARALPLVAVVTFRGDGRTDGWGIVGRHRGPPRVPLGRTAGPYP